jgi:hypothetical protein
MGPGSAEASCGLVTQKVATNRSAAVIFAVSRVVSIAIASLRDQLRFRPKRTIDASKLMSIVAVYAGNGCEEKKRCEEQSELSSELDGVRV